ncbi:unnamed protein product [Colias eurytheme]|nr:unnamed protein product [Colias eurytheme]
MEFKILFFVLTVCHQTLSYHRYWRNSNNGYQDYDYPFNQDKGTLVFPDSSEEDYPRWNVFPTTTRRPYINNIQSCISTCPASSQYRPVCGTDGVTYQNIDRLRCAMKCGVDVQLKYRFACGQFSSTESPTNNGNNLQACMNECPTTSEYNPVCGTDNVTYNNIGKLYCAQRCGSDVDIKRKLPCPKPTTQAPTEPPNNSVENVQSCIATCPVTSEYNPVCGTNGVTYNNEGQLECAKSCGVDVSLRGRTACFLLTTSSPTAGDVPFPDMTTKSTSFTIPQDILNSIFTKTPDDDDNVEPQIDPRFESNSS